MQEKRKKQVYNPYLPDCEYIPDGEPHVFGERLYVYGSHDRFDGEQFCLNDYVCYSASVHDLTEWKYEGVIFRKEQDPRNQQCGEKTFDLPYHVHPRYTGGRNLPGIHAMWAPDVVQGPDGRYYLYYCLDVLPEIGVAVCDTPAGNYVYLGLVRHADGTPLGCGEGDLIQFDPGIFVDDDGEIYLYSGNAPISRVYPDDHKGSQVMRLEKDMLTLKTVPRRLLPSVFESEGTGFEGHEFFEASSIRKIHEKYYLVYSSVQSHELCYAVSDFPDRDYRYGGTLIDIADIGLDGRTEEEAVNCTGNTHGGIEQVNGQWYIFYHRQTNRTQYSRQGCAEKIRFDADGRIRQVPVTSCGLNDGPLEAKGGYPAGICSHLTGKNGIVFSGQDVMRWDYPFLTQDCPDIDMDAEGLPSEHVQYVANIMDGTAIGYRTFLFHRVNKLQITVRGRADGKLQVYTRAGGGVFAKKNMYKGSRSFECGEDDEDFAYMELCGEIPVHIFADNWLSLETSINVPDGEKDLYLKYEGSGWLDLHTILFR